MMLNQNESASQKTYLSFLYSFAFLVLILSLFSSCKDFFGKKLTSAEKETITSRLTESKDSVMIVWNEMTKANEGELEEIKHLLDLIAIVDDHDSLALAKAFKVFHKFKKINYTLQFVSYSDSIDYFDNQLTELIKVSFKAAENSPKVGQFPLYFTLVDQIKEYDDGILMRRVLFDRAAGKYNTFLGANEPFISQLGDEFKSLKPFPVFAVPL